MAELQHSSARLQHLPRLPVLPLSSLAPPPPALDPARPLPGSSVLLLASSSASNSLPLFLVERACVYIHSYLHTFPIPGPRIRLCSQERVPQCPNENDLAGTPLTPRGSDVRSCYCSIRSALRVFSALFVEKMCLLPQNNRIANHQLFYPNDYHHRHAHHYSITGTAIACNRLQHGRVQLHLCRESSRCGIEVSAEREIMLR